jgi:hypothetical protein
MGDKEEQHWPTHITTSIERGPWHSRGEISFGDDCSVSHRNAIYPFVFVRDAHMDLTSDAIFHSSTRLQHQPML